MHFLASTMDPVCTDRRLTAVPTHTPDTMARTDRIVVPGSQNPVPVLSDKVSPIGCDAPRAAASGWRLCAPARTCTAPPVR